jgi:ADP-heptose:LPS heptosyltransferase
MTKIKAWLLRTLTRKKQIKFDRRQIRSIIALRYDRIGDMIVSLPLLKALKNGFPNAKICVVASATNVIIAEGCEFIDTTVIKPNSIMKWALVLLKLRFTNPSLVIDLNHSVAPHTILATLFIKPMYAASPFKDGRWGVQGNEIELFDIMPAHHQNGYRRPLAETYLDIAKVLNCPTVGCLPYPLKHHTPPHNEGKRPYIVLNPCGSRPAMCLKRNDLERIASIILKISPSLEIFIPSMDTTHNWLSEMMREWPNTRVLAPTETIAPLLPLIQFSALVITPDTALVHIAAAYETPLLAIYTSDHSLFEQWRPLNTDRSKIIRSNYPKSLDGYSSDDLIEHCELMVKEYAVNKQS